MSLDELSREAERLMVICNACRYCEGYCAVFPAMELRQEFSKGDLSYLANLCHNCGACYYACQYAPPHEFDVNVPKVLAALRAETYRSYAWPESLGRLFERNGIAVAIITALALALFMILTFALVEPSVLYARHVGEGAFYAVISHEVMVLTFGLVSLWVLAVLAVGFLRFWRDTGEPLPRFVERPALGQALRDALSLRYLEGGGDGCTYPGERPSSARRWFHHLTFYGFMLCFAATTTGTIYHYGFGWQAPYGYLALPSVLGTVGGIGLLVGPAGLLWLRANSDPALTDQNQLGMDAGFLVLLFLASLTGLILTVLRATPAMGVLLAVHLGVVLGLFLLLPYCKFVHALYRFAALVRYALERPHPEPVPADES